MNKERKPPHQAPQKTIPEDSGTKDFLEGKLTRKGLLIHLAQERAEVTKAIKLLDRRSKRVNNKEPEKPLNQAYVTFHFHAAKNLAIKKHKVTLWSKLRPDPNIILKVCIPAILCLRMILNRCELCYRTTGCTSARHQTLKKLFGKTLNIAARNVCFVNFLLSLGE